MVEYTPLERRGGVPDAPPISEAFYDGAKNVEVACVS